MFWRSYLEGSEHSETLFLEPKNHFHRQGWSSVKFYLQSKIFKEIGQLVGEREGENGSKFMSCFSKKNFDN